MGAASWGPPRAGAGERPGSHSQNAAWPVTQVGFIFYWILFSGSCREFPWFLVSALRYTHGDGARGEVTKKQDPQCVSPLYSSHSMNTITKAFYFLVGNLCTGDMLLDSVCRLLLWLLKGLQAHGVAQGSWCLRQRAAHQQQWSLCSRDMEGRMHVTLLPCAGGCQRGQSVRTALLPSHPRQVRVSKAQRLVGREGRDSGEKEEGPCFSAYIDDDLSLSRRLVSTAVVTSSFSWSPTSDPTMPHNAMVSSLACAAQSRAHRWNSAVPVLPLLWGVLSSLCIHLFLCPVRNEPAALLLLMSWALTHPQVLMTSELLLKRTPRRLKLQ